MCTHAYTHTTHYTLHNTHTYTQHAQVYAWGNNLGDRLGLGEHKGSQKTNPFHVFRLEDPPEV